MFEQSDMFPGNIPDVVARIWKAVLDWYAASRFGEPSVQQIVNRMALNDPLLPASVETIRRARKRWPDLLPWPIKRGQQPPWLPPIDVTPLRALQQLLSIGRASDAPLDLPPGVKPFGVILGLDGELHDVGVEEETGVIKLLKRVGVGAASVAAMFCGVFTILDYVSDGRLDRHIAWCYLLLTHVHVRF